jgi:hypothetical protein
MNTTVKRGLCAAATSLLITSAVSAQTAPPTFQGDPDIYKIIFEDQNFRVIAGTWKKGVHDKSHSHPVASVVYSLTDCLFRLYAADGATRDLSSKAGTAMAVPIIASHSAENIGPTDCHVIFVERK